MSTGTLACLLLVGGCLAAAPPSPASSLIVGGPHLEEELVVHSQPINVVTVAPTPPGRAARTAPVPVPAPVLAPAPATPRHVRLGGFLPYALVPLMMLVGYAPFILSFLKVLVLKGLLVNKLALLAATYLTLRTLVFGPVAGHTVKYANFGYDN